MDPPDGVRLLCSASMAPQAKRLEAMLNRQQILTSVMHDIPDSNFARIRQSALDIRAELFKKCPDASLVLNITGGNKLMSLGFYEIFNEVKRCQIIYTDTASGYIESLKNHKRWFLKSVLNIEDYLAAYGAKVTSIQYAVSAAQQQVAMLLGQRAQQLSYKNLIKILNGMTQTALSKAERLEDFADHARQRFKSQPDDHWVDVLKFLAAQGFLSYDPEKWAVCFNDEAAAEFLRGHWLEIYAWQLAHEVGFDHVAMNVAIQWEDSDVTNELDLVIVHQNRLLAIECKTVSFDNNHQSTKDMLYKIHSIGDSIKGVYGQVALLTVMQPPDHFLERAETQKLNVIYPQELRNYLQEWRHSFSDANKK